MEVDSKHLVPGNVVRVPSGVTCPCDAVVVDGLCIADEAMLTGESMPVGKRAPDDLYAILRRIAVHDFREELPDTLTLHMVFAGTMVVRSQCSTHDSLAVAMVLRTGFATSKGNLVRAILHPRPQTHQFVADSMAFLGVLLLIALVGMCYTFYEFVQHGVETL